jgi:hypothetical protein
MRGKSYKKKQRKCMNKKVKKIKQGNERVAGEETEWKYLTGENVMCCSYSSEITITENTQVKPNV